MAEIKNQAITKTLSKIPNFTILKPNKNERLQ